MAKSWISLLLLAGLSFGSGAAAQGLASGGKWIAEPPAPKKPADPKKPVGSPVPTCTLVSSEGPRGGRLEVEGEHFGKAPLVKIAGRVTRMIERTPKGIAVQIPADSDGGPVTVKVGALEAACGTLTIIGKNG
jgi:hypothetical protein